MISSFAVGAALAAARGGVKPRPYARCSGDTVLDSVFHGEPAVSGRSRIACYSRIIVKSNRINILA